MRSKKKNPNKPTDMAVEIKPSALSLACISQFVQCSHVEKGLHIPDNILFVN